MRINLVAILLFSPILALAQPIGVKSCSGFPYRVRHEVVPAYRLPDEASPVVKELRLGEKVCYIGEQGAFAYLQWDDPLPPVVGTEAPRSMVFVKRISIESTGEVPGRALQEKSMKEKVRDFYYNIQSGSVPEDGLAPIRPLLQLFGQPGSPWEAPVATPRPAP